MCSRKSIRHQIEGTQTQTYAFLGVCSCVPHLREPVAGRVSYTKCFALLEVRQISSLSALWGCTINYLLIVIIAGKVKVQMYMQVVSYTYILQVGPIWYKVGERRVTELQLWRPENNPCMLGNGPRCWKDRQSPRGTALFRLLCHSQTVPLVPTNLEYLGPFPVIAFIPSAVNTSQLT